MIRQAIRVIQPVLAGINEVHNTEKADQYKLKAEKFLIEKLSPQRIKFRYMGHRNTFGLTTEQQVQLDADYSLCFALLNNYESIYADLIDAYNTEIKNQYYKNEGN